MLSVISAITAQILIAIEGSIASVAAAIAVFTGIGAGVGIGLATGKAVEAIARQPEASGKIQAVLMLGLAFAETTAIYGTFIAILILFV
ncbi:MAG: ATP synthase F0 subunit C [Clostridiales bacterium]|jgi:F-type H+-transporting ATPase subunit c|nr:ATP synthase F0 subunit C [Clostridiales bacterium]